jgi:hypothetical protein
MKAPVIKTVLALLVGSCSTAFASISTLGISDNSMLVWFFIAFGAMILFFQATPALITFISIVRGLFSTSPSTASFSPWKSKNDK